MTKPGASVLIPSLAVAFSAVFWGTTWIPLRRMSEAGVPDAWSGTLIYALPALVALPMLFLRWPRIRSGGWPLLAVVLGVGACNALFSVALTFGEVGMIILLFYLNPIWATVLERIFIGTPIAGHRLAGIALGLLGMVALQGLAGRWPVPGNAAEWMGLVAGACWAVGLVFSNVARNASIVDKTALQFVAAALVSLLLVLGLGGAAQPPTSDGVVAGLPWMVGAALVWILPAMGLSLWGASRMSPARASMILMLEVLVGVGSAAWLAGEELGLNKLVGGALILSASAVEAWGSARLDHKAAVAAREAA